MNQNHVRKNSFNENEITELENSKYWRKKLKQNDFHAFAIELLGMPVGLIRLDRGVISIAIYKRFKNKNIDFESLSAINLDGCIAQIKPSNRMSQKLFKKLGFKETRRVFEWDGQNV